LLVTATGDAALNPIPWVETQTPSMEIRYAKPFLMNPCTTKAILYSK
jgi:hypothetical protein